jgi:hypothetical protein
MIASTASLCAATCPQCDGTIASAGTARVTEIDGIRTVEQGTRLYCLNDRKHELTDTSLAVEFSAA